jgi:NADPH2:quinone reductase
VRAAFDAVGRATFDDSLKAVARRGHMILFGQSSGPAEPIDPRRLQQEGSLFLTRPGLADYTRSRQELLGRAGEVLGLVRSGELRVHVHERYPLAQAAQAHRALESRTTIGKLLLIP